MTICCKRTPAMSMILFFMVMFIFIPPLTAKAADSQASGGYWKLVNVTVQDHRTDSTESVTCTREGDCESTQTGGDGALVYKVSHSWSAPPQRLAPNETIPVTFKLRNVQIKNYRGGRASLDARLAGQGWAFIGSPQGSFVIGTEQPAGAVVERTDTKHRSYPAGRSGDKMVYEVHVKGGMVRQYNYIYEWTESGSIPSGVTEAQPHGKQWTLVNVTVQDHRTDSTESVACTREGDCESTQTGGDGALVYKVSHSWSAPPQRLAPNEAIPVTFKLRNVQIKNYRGGRASLDARLAGQGWAFIGSPQGSFVIGTEQPAGAVVERTDTKHRSYPAGRSGDKMVYEVHVKGGMVRQYNYIYEWTE